jgi:endogenous inhibitor of DNA gyrase (YacG/DUF329 family)
MRQKELTDFQTSGVECPTCGEVFSENGVAAHHWQAHCEKLRKTVKCDNCGVELEREPAEVFDTNFCDSDCQYEYQSGESHHRYNSVVRPCSNCGNELERNVSHVSENGPFCDHSCYGEWLSENRSGTDSYRWERQEVECEWCGETFYKQRDQIEERPNHFCTHECYQDYQRENSHPVDLVDTVRNSLSDTRWQYVADDYRNDGNKVCKMCGCVPGPQSHDVHHIVPIVSGGSNHECNLMTLCDHCHGKAEQFVRQYPEFDPVLVD